MCSARSLGTFFFVGTFCLAAVAGSYWVGYQAGVRHGAVAETAATVPPSDAPRAGTVADAAPESPPVSEFQRLLDGRAWFQLEQWLDVNRAEVTARHGLALVDVLRASVNKYDALAMRRVLSAYLEAEPGDHEALFLLADLQQVSGMPETALETLFSVMALPLDTAQSERARTEADQIIRMIDAQLRNRGAGLEREAFWRLVSQRVPGSDRYRYEWAAALAGVQRWEDARRVLMETGTTDITQAVIDELAGELALVEEDMTFVRDGDRLLSRVSVPSGLTFTLLVDTGANVTSFSRHALRTLGAERTSEAVRIRTAGGVVETGVYRVAELEVQGQYFNDVRVLELPVVLPGLDGLLGLDIIHQLSADPLRLKR